VARALRGSVLPTLPCRLEKLVWAVTGPGTAGQLCDGVIVAVHSWQLTSSGVVL
jgi:hypothetical protein